MYTVDNSVGNQRVRCKRCNTRFVAEPTIVQEVTETRPASQTIERPFASLPAEFGRYRVLEELGRGGMGCVYRALDTHLGREVALKLPSFGSQDDVRRAARFVHEGKAAAALQHPNICTVYDAGEIDGKPFMAMELVSGRPLSSWTNEVSPNLALEWCTKIASALAHAHQKGIVHRDLKPDNVVINEEGQPKLMDFGLAKLIGDSDPEQSKLTHDGAVMGTPSYMSPEQARGDQQSIGPATDIYSLGVLLYELLTGSTPYAGTPAVVMAQIIASPVPNIRDVHPLVNENLNSLVRKALAKSPSERFTSATAMADALKPLATLPNLLQTYIAPVAGVARQPKRRRANNKRFVIIGSALAGVVVLAGILFTLRTKYGEVIIELSAPTAEVSVSVDGEVISLSSLGKDYKIAAGEHGLKVSGPGFETVSQSFTVREGSREIVKVDLKNNHKTARAELKDIGQNSAGDFRDVAKKVIELGGIVNVSANGQVYSQLRSIDTLPKTDFAITYVGFWHLKKIEDKDLECLNGLTNLTGIGLDGTSITDAGLRVLDQVRTLTRVEIGGTNVSEKGVESLLLRRPEITDMVINDLPVTDRITPLLTKCTFLWLHRTKISDQGLAVFKGRSIGTLILNGTPISDEGLKHFEGTRIQHLGLENTRISDVGLSHLAKMKSIDKIDLGGTRVTQAGLEEFRNVFPNCRIKASISDGSENSALDSNGSTQAEKNASQNKVELGASNGIENSGKLTEANGLMQAEREAARKLIELGAVLGVELDGKVLDVSSIEQLPNQDFHIMKIWSKDMGERMSDEQVTLIAALPHLKYFSLPGCSITDAGFERIPQIEQLEVIHLFFAKRLTSAGIDRLLSRAKSLQDLALEGSQITDDMLSRIVPAKLSGVNLSDTKIGDQGIANFSGKKTYGLLLGQTNITDDAMLTIANSVTGYLRLFKTAVTDDGLKHLVGRRLQHLDLNDTSVSDSGMQHLSQMESLDELVIRNTKVTEAGLKLIRERFPKIKIQH
jgi:predicted Ser/Thr protein kinase